MKKLPIYLFLLLLLTCAKEDSQNPYTPPIQITKQYTLTVSAGDGGSVSTAGGTFSQGTQVSITAIPNDGYIFAGWTNGSNDNPLNLTLNSDTSLTANFEIYNTFSFDNYYDIDYLKPSHYTRIPYLHNNYEGLYNTYGIGLVRDNYVGPPRDAVIIDYNGDGFYDLVHSGSDWKKSFDAVITDDDPLGVQYRNKIQFFYGNQTGELTLDTNMSSKFWGLIHGYKGNVNDYNNDGIPDMLFAGTGFHGPSINNSPQEYLNHEYPTMLLSKGIGEYEQINFYELSDNYDHSVSSGDFDNDGDIDVIFIKPGNRAAWVFEYGMSIGRLLKNNGDGTFEIIELVQTQLNNNQTREITNQLVPEDKLFNKFTSELVDINNDGFLDLILGGSKDSGSHILIGNGIDFMTEIIELPGVPNYDFIIDFAMYDYDDDGDIDIIANRIPDTDSGSHYEGWYMQVLNNQGGQFIDVTSSVINDNYYLGGTYWVNFIHISDFDNDGIIELFNNTIDRNTEWKPCDTCNMPRLEWELIDGNFIKKN